MDNKQSDNSNDWEKVITIEIGEKGQCEFCKGIISSEKIGEHLYCEKCQAYLWRKKIVQNK